MDPKSKAGSVYGAATIALSGVEAGAGGGNPGRALVDPGSE